MEKYGFVYIWRDRKHKRYYIGCHWGTENDGYICSSQWMLAAYKKRPQDFKRRILLRVESNKADLFEAEHKILSMIKPHEIKVRYYNLNIKSIWHWSADPDNALSIREKLSIGSKKARENPEIKKKYDDAYARRRGKPQDPELVTRRRESMIKTLSEKFPKENRKKRLKKNSSDLIELHRRNTTEMWQNRSKEQINTINNKIREIKIQNNSLLVGQQACVNANTGSIRLYKENRYKKALPHSDKYHQLISEGWGPKLPRAEFDPIEHITDCIINNKKLNGRLLMKYEKVDIPGLYLSIKNMEQPTCDWCSKPTRFKSIKEGFLTYCNVKCSRNGILKSLGYHDQIVTLL